MDVRSCDFHDKPVKRLFLVLGHGVLTPNVRKERSCGYFEAAAEPSLVPDMPGVLITTGERGKSVDLARFNGVGKRGLSLPHEMLMRIQEALTTKKHIDDVGEVKKMLQKLRKDGVLPGTVFTVRTPGTELASAVMWAPGERIIYGGVWMIDLKNPTRITNAAGTFGLAERSVDELECHHEALDAKKQKELELATKDYGFTPDSAERMKTDLGLQGTCRGELKYVDRDEDDLITMADFLARGQPHLRADDIMVVVMCRNYAPYAADYMRGSKSPRSSKTEGKVHDFGGGRLKKRKRTSKKTKKKTRTLKRKQK
jgi:hypothetical protein